MSKKLLLADDSVTIQKVIQITFAHEDYDLTVTDNGDEAFRKAREIKPDLVLADVYMPGKNGYDLCAALKQDPACQKMPVLLLTGSFEPFDEDKARAVKADAWLEKPFESQALLDKVAELLTAAEAGEPEAAPEAASEAAEQASDLDALEDFAFDEEPDQAEAAVSATSADDWSDLSDFVESAAEQPLAAEGTPRDSTEASAEVPAAEQEEGLEQSAEDDDMFIFEDEAEGEELPPEAESQPDEFEADDEDIMALDDDDILGSEDLEPLEEEPTLAAWSRGEVADRETSLDDFDLTTEDFAEPASSATDEEEEPVPDFATEPEFAEEPAPDFATEPEFTEEPALPAEPASSETAMQPEQEWGSETTPEPETSVETFAEPAADAADEQSVAAFGAEEEAFETVAEPSEETGPADATEVEARTAAMSEAEIEAVVEKVAGRVVEKLAGTILERVAWEVVPDLAETLIREEIKNIKEATG